MRSRLILAAALLLTACSTAGKPVAEPQITPPAPKPGPQEDCKKAIIDDSCVSWTAPEPHRFSEIARLSVNGTETGTDKGARWGAYYACDVIKDDVAKEALGSADVVRLVNSKYNCQVIVRGRKFAGVYDNLSIHIAPYEPGNAAYDWFTEPNPLGDVTTVKGRKAIRKLQWSGTTGDRILYIIEIPNHGAVWNIEVDRMAPSRGSQYTPNAEEIERRAQVVIDALMAYDVT